LIVTLVTYLYFNRSDGLYRVRATVTNEQGVPVEDAKVWSSVGGEPKKIAGGSEFNIPAATKPLDGKITFFAEKESAFLKGQAELTLDKDFNPTVTIKLSRDTSAKVRGQVTDTKFHGIAGARVFVVGYEAEAVITKEGGNFELPAHEASAERPDDSVVLKHPDVADSLIELARVHQSLQKYPEAEAAWKRSLAILEKVVAPDHFRLLRPLKGYLELLYRMKRQDEFKAVEKRIKTIEKKYPQYDNSNKKAS
jgi:Tetratricopeptide repeat